MLIVSTVMRMIGNIIMIFSGNIFMVCASLAFYALSYNFSSGSGDALAYDSLKMVSREAYYEKYASNQMIIYRLCSGISTMCAGFALLIGSIRKELVSCFMESLSFLHKAKKAVLLMFCNSLVGAVDTLLLFFLQAKLPQAGLLRHSVMMRFR